MSNSTNDTVLTLEEIRHQLSDESEEVIRGVVACRDLNEQVRHREPLWVTLRNWKSFNQHEKDLTMQVHSSAFPGRFDEKPADATDKEVTTDGIPNADSNP